MSVIEALVKDGGEGRPPPAVYVQVNIGEEEQKGGCPLDEVGNLVAAVRASPLPLAGLMAIPPVGVEPAPYFALLAKLARRHDVTGPEHWNVSRFQGGRHARRDRGSRWDRAVRGLIVRFDGIIFDFDGVLIESEHEINRLIAGLLTELGHPTTARETHSSILPASADSIHRCG